MAASPAIQIAATATTTVSGAVSTGIIAVSRRGMPFPSASRAASAVSPAAPEARCRASAR
ncbi:hypothetical protein [Actinoplanes sichuanensis]|uniref:hypothetical protein n=1 Tax=Actinoplanes sichuanensis TaxID=512349 RepID=UPI002952B658|nr:hypothetical protein [Actinoplanes sichuanensis]